MRLALAACALALTLALGCATLEGARLYQSGSSALDRGDAQRAIADLEQAAGRVPHASEIHNHLGIAYAQAGRHEDALRAFERAVALDCDNAAAQANLRAARAREAARGGALAGPASPAGAGPDAAGRAPAAP